MSDQHTSDSAQPGAAAAAQLLQASDTVGDRVREAIDARTQAIIDAWMAVAVVAYALAFALSVDGANGTGLIPGIEGAENDGGDVGFLVVAGLFATFTLTAGLSESLRRPKQPGAGLRRAGSAAASMLPFISVVSLDFRVPATPWPAALALTIAATAPAIVIALRSASRARTAGVRRPEPTLSGLLDPTGRAVTVAVGVWLGGIGLLSGPAFGFSGSIATIAFLLLLIGSRTTRIGLDRLAEDWGPAQWTALGCSYSLVLTLSVVLSRTTWDLNTVSVVGGILIAAPLVVAAFRPAPIWAV